MQSVLKYAFPRIPLDFRGNTLWLNLFMLHFKLDAELHLGFSPKQGEEMSLYRCFQVQKLQTPLPY